MSLFKVGGRGLAGIGKARYISCTSSTSASRIPLTVLKHYETYKPSTQRAYTSMASETNGQANGYTNGNMHPHIKLYTNHRCPFAHRAHIALEELGLPFEEVIIDLNTPRPQWYLDINPRGLVPSIKYSNGVLEEEVITESAIVSQFLCDERPSHLLPASKSSPTAALERARITFFYDTWNTKIQGAMYDVLKADGKEKAEKTDAWAAAIEKEIEPLLADANPFYGGSKELTFAEVIVAPFLIRFYALSKDGEMLSSSFVERLEKLPNFGKWAKAVCERPSVLKIWDEKEVVENTKSRIKRMKEAAK